IAARAEAIEAHLGGGVAGGEPVLEPGLAGEIAPLFRPPQERLEHEAGLPLAGLRLGGRALEGAVGVALEPARTKGMREHELGRPPAGGRARRRARVVDGLAPVVVL